MIYKAVISDFARTIVGRERVISANVKQAIREVVKKEIPFSFATGRLFAGYIKDTCKELGLTAPQITQGGAEIVNPVTGQVLIGEYIPDLQAKEVLAFLEKIDAWFVAERGDTVYTKDGLPIAPFGPVPFKKLSELVVHDIPKIGIGGFAKGVNEEKMEEELKERFPNLHITRAHSPSGKSWDITAPIANKHIAVLRVAELLKISPQEIIGIGDGYNDLPLLEACGLKVAMGNAEPEVKEIADYIAPSLEKDGVEDVLEKFIIGAY